MEYFKLLRNIFHGKYFSSEPLSVFAEKEKLIVSRLDLSPEIAQGLADARLGLIPGDGAQCSLLWRLVRPGEDMHGAQVRGVSVSSVRTAFILFWKVIVQIFREGIIGQDRICIHTWF